jgi:Mrp family chromosome partitioning ATPase
MLNRFVWNCLLPALRSDNAFRLTRDVLWNLARVAATASKVVLVETDLRNPSLAHQHGLDSVPGLSAVLTHQVELERAIQTMDVASAAANGAGGEQALDVIVAGANPPNPAELIESKAMSDVLSRSTG